MYQKTNTRRFAEPAGLPSMSGHALIRSSLHIFALLMFFSPEVYSKVRVELTAQRALTMLSNVAKLNLKFDARAVKHFRAPVLKAKLSTHDALTQALIGGYLLVGSSDKFFTNKSCPGLLYIADPIRPLFVPVQPRTIGLSY